MAKKKPPHLHPHLLPLLLPHRLLTHLPPHLLLTQPLHLLLPLAKRSNSFSIHKKATLGWLFCVRSPRYRVGESLFEFVKQQLGDFLGGWARLVLPVNAEHHGAASAAGLG